MSAKKCKKEKGVCYGWGFVELTVLSLCVTEDFFLTLLEKIIIVYNCSVMFKILGQILKTLTVRFINVQNIERKWGE